MAHAAAAGDGEDRDVPIAVTPPDTSDRARRRGRPDTPEQLIELILDAGRAAGIRPGDLVGAITGEAGVPSRSIGAIQIADDCSTVEVPESLADRIMAALKATRIRGRRVSVRRKKTKSRAES
jgi:ATP-dependent RNA helicase DeaD